MGRFYRFLLSVVTLGFLVVFSAFPNKIYAQVNIEGPTPTPPVVPGIIIPNPDVGDRVIYPGNEEISVTARVGDFVVNITGLASPNASVVLEDNTGQFLRSTVADSEGYFSISGLVVKGELDELCFETIDFRRLGNSESCLETGGFQNDQDLEDVFLPPTIGLFAKTIDAGTDAVIYGYSMPNATVDVRIAQGQIFNVASNSEGYYEYRYENVPAGRYELSSVAEFETLETLEPLSSVELESLTLPEQAARTTGEIVTTTEEVLTETLLGFLLFILLLLLIIAIILIFILKPAWTRAIFEKFRRYTMHHDWLIDFVDKYQAA